MSFDRTRPSLAVGLAVLTAGVGVVKVASSASLARSGLLRWLRDLKSPLFRSLRLSGGVPERLLDTLSGRLKSGVRNRLMFDDDLWLCALSGRCSWLSFLAAANPSDAPAITAPASISLMPFGRSAFALGDEVSSGYLSSLALSDLLLSKG